MTARQRSLAPWWCAVAILAAACAAYHNSLHGPFVFDDASSIVTNPTIRRLWPPGEVLAGPITNVTAQGRPILNLSLALNHALGGTAVEGYHVLNLIIHALAGLTLFGVLRRTLASLAFERATPLACAIALLWVVHPLQTESVTYTIQRAESLVGLFYLLTIYCFARAVGPVSERSLPASDAGSAPRSAWWFTLSVIACVCGMATKEVMATAPLMVLFFDRTFFSDTFLSALRRRRGYYLALAGTWLLLAWLIARTGGNRGGSVGFGVGVAWWDYWLTQFVAIAHYLRLALWPHPLVFEYGVFWVRSLGAIAWPLVLVVALLAATVVALRRRSPVGFLGAWFFGILAPTSLAPGTTQMIVEHRMYLPLAAVLTLLVVAWDRAVGRRARWLGVVIVLAGALLTVRRNDTYRSDVTLWRDTVVKRPDNPLAHFMLAGAEERAGETARAIASYERALALKPDFSIAQENFGELLLRAGRQAEAIEHFETALRLQPNYADAHANLGNALLAAGRAADGLQHLATATELAPDSGITHYNYANALAATGRNSDAIAHYEAALQRDPGMAEAHFNLGNLLIEAGRAEAAIAHFEAAVRVRPDFAAAHYNLANVLAASGRQREAVPHYEAALRARPAYPEAHHNLGSALFELGQLEEAARHYEETLRLAPDFPDARAHLEQVRARLRSQ